MRPTIVIAGAAALSIIGSNRVGALGDCATVSGAGANSTGEAACYTPPPPTSPITGYGLLCLAPA